MENMKAIIVDDEKHVREGLMLLADWEKVGIETIYEAEDGDEAIRVISTHQPAIIFTDMRMPKRDGISLLKWIRTSNISSKTIVVSGYDDYEYMRKAIHYHSFDYLLKPIDPDILNETLEKAVMEWQKQKPLQTASTEEWPIEKNNMQEIKEFLQEHYQHDISLQEIADRFFLSKEYISRKFKHEFNKTITDYVTKIRMEKAKQLLDTQNLKIYEIAHFVGYHNEKYFSKVFKKQVGMTPNEYRNVISSK